MGLLFLQSSVHQDPFSAMVSRVAKPAVVPFSNSFKRLFLPGCINWHKFSGTSYTNPVHFPTNSSEQRTYFTFQCTSLTILFGHFLLRAFCDYPVISTVIKISFPAPLPATTEAFAISSTIPTKAFAVHRRCLILEQRHHHRLPFSPIRENWMLFLVCMICWIIIYFSWSIITIPYSPTCSRQREFLYSAVLRHGISYIRIRTEYKWHRFLQKIILFDHFCAGFFNRFHKWNLHPTGSARPSFIRWWLSVSLSYCAWGTDPCFLRLYQLWILLNSLLPYYALQNICSSSSSFLTGRSVYRRVVIVFSLFSVIWRLSWILF